MADPLTHAPVGDCSRITTGHPCAFCRRWSCPLCQRCWMSPRCHHPWLHRWHAAQSGWSVRLSETAAVWPRVGHIQQGQKPQGHGQLVGQNACHRQAFCVDCHAGPHWSVQTLGHFLHLYMLHHTTDYVQQQGKPQWGQVTTADARCINRLSSTSSQQVQHTPRQRPCLPDAGYTALDPKAAAQPPLLALAPRAGRLILGRTYLASSPACLRRLVLGLLSA